MLTRWGPSERVEASPGRQWRATRAQLLALDAVAVDRAVVMRVLQTDGVKLYEEPVGADPCEEPGPQDFDGGTLGSCL
jgi:hypothetical protein